MFLLDDVVIYGSGDLTLATSCEFALLRRLDSLLGTPSGAGISTVDPFFERTARLGAAHEHRLLADFEKRFGPVETIARPEFTATGLHDAHRATVAAARAGAPVIYQGTFYDGRFLGFCDFLVRQPDGSYAVYDAKLSRHADVPALLQTAGYAVALTAAGLRTADRIHLLLGDGSDSVHPLAELAPVHQARRAALERLLDGHRAGGTPAAWGDGRYAACGRCDTCGPEVERHRDLLLVAGIRSDSRRKLVAAGIRTIDELARHSGPVAGLSGTTLTTLRAQAAIQVRRERTETPQFEVFHPAALAALPRPDAGDLYFDFEGDPLWAERGSSDWGLEYLFGILAEPVPGSGSAPPFRAFRAHDREQERRALLRFLDYVRARRREFPGMHVYHYAAYEKTALLRLAARHGVGEDAVDDLLRDGVLVDLYPIVRAALRIGERSYSIKKLEPLYTDDRHGEVTTAVDSVVEYARYCELRDRGDHDAAADVLQGIVDYNEDDCVSTRTLRNWLLARADEHGVSAIAPVAAHADPDPDVESATAEQTEEDRITGVLCDFAGPGPRAARSADQQAAALLAASLGYHRRERKPFWWEHFDRLKRPAHEWASERDVLVGENVEVLADWHRNTPRQNLRRHLRMEGRFGDGSTVGPGDSCHVLYAAPAPVALAGTNPAERGARDAKVLAVDVGASTDTVVVEEILARDAAPYADHPMAVTPGSPLRTDSIERAIATVAGKTAAALPTLPADAAMDLLRRVPPRMRSGNPLPIVSDGNTATALTAALRDLDGSYIAVHGPPGTGKTYIGARVIADLVSQHRWRVGVVAQSHSVIENMLDAIVRAGLEPARVAKKAGRPGNPDWTVIKDSAYAQFLADATATGCVVGGTAWDFANPRRVPPGTLDLLVIDEAGQFALANTVAVGAAARNLLLLGDPQQLPQVSQGIHPEPVGESALGWLAEGHDALPPDRGYFLERTWRMHPALCAPVSALAYGGRLRSEEAVTTARHLDGVPPGIHTVVLDHSGNATYSAAESAAITSRIGALVGRSWTDPGDFDGARPLAPSDVLVVAPYNAQVALIRADLQRAGLADVHVGTVDKLQGRQAAVVFVSMTASSADDVPRGMSFLLSRNRLNVAVSRGKWCAVIVHARMLTQHLPATPSGLTELGAFMRLARGTAESR